MSADCADEKESSRRRLEDIAQLTALAWAYGWESTTVGGQVLSRLRIYPAAA